MDTTTITRELGGTVRYTWGAGVAGGLVGGIGMGVVLHAGSNMMPFIGALYGWPTVTGGWIAHLFNSVVLGLLFALIVSHPAIRSQITSLSGYLVGGVLYAAAVGLGTTGIMLPAAMNALGVQTLPESLLPFPGLIGQFIVIVSVGVAHLVYGLLLGATFGYINNPGRMGP